MDDKKPANDKATCKTCFWFSKAGYCVEGPNPPRRVKEPCEKHTPLMHIK